jgi:chromosome segregation ATPase
MTASSKRSGNYEEAYHNLCSVYKKAVNDLHKMANKNLSLYQDLERSEQIGQSLETRIRDLENERSKTMREHESALADSTNRLHATERKIEEIEKTRWTTESQELDLQVLSPELMFQAASPELIWSPSTERGRTSEAGHEESDQQHGEPPKKFRKRKQGSNAKARDA